MLTDIEIASIEAVIEQFGTVLGVRSACRKYQRELQPFRDERRKLNLLRLERLDSSAFARVLASLSPQQSSEISDFIHQYKGQPLPEVQRASTLSEAKAIAAAKGGGTIVKP